MNAKIELLENLTGKSKIKCAKLRYEPFLQGSVKKFVLKTNHSEAELTDFFESLNFEYDDGYGSQELFGDVWLEDGTWLERGEYDGSEWWDHIICPEIPEECKP